MVDEETGVCAICHRRLPRDELKPAASLMAGTAEALGVAELAPDALVCRDDRARGRRLRVERLLERERGALGDLEREVIASLDSGLPVSEDVEAAFEERRAFGERTADAMASFGGSWPFILFFCAVLIVWYALEGLWDGLPVAGESGTLADELNGTPLQGKLRSAIQITTAAGICAVLDLLATGKLPQQGFIRQEDVALDDFLANRFGRLYAPAAATKAAA